MLTTAHDRFLDTRLVTRVYAAMHRVLLVEVPKVLHVNTFLNESPAPKLVESLTPVGFSSTRLVLNYCFRKTKRVAVGEQ